MLILVLMWTTDYNITKCTVLYLFPAPPPLVIDPNEECPPLTAAHVLEYRLPPEPPVPPIALR